MNTNNINENTTGANNSPVACSGHDQSMGKMEVLERFMKTLRPLNEDDAYNSTKIRGTLELISEGCPWNAESAITEALFYYLVADTLQKRHIRQIAGTCAEWAYYRGYSHGGR